MVSKMGQFSVILNVSGLFFELVADCKNCLQFFFFLNKMKASTVRHNKPKSGVWLHFSVFTDAFGVQKVKCKLCLDCLGLV